MRPPVACSQSLRRGSAAANQAVPFALGVLTLFLGVQVSFSQTTATDTNAVPSGSTNGVSEVSLPPLLPTTPTATTNDLYYQPQLQSAISQLRTTAPASVGSGQLTSPFNGTSAISAPGNANAPFAGAPATGGLSSGEGSSARALISWGPIDVHGQISDSISYGDGLQSTPGHNSGTFIETLTPGVTFYLGSHWILSYAPGFTYYSNPTFPNTISQTALLAGFARLGDWSLSLAQNFSHSTQPLIETGTETTQDAYGTLVSASRPFGSRFSWELNVGQNYRLASPFANEDDWNAGTWLNFRPIPQFSTGLGVSGAYDRFGGSDMASQQYQARVQFAPGSKLSLSVQAGMSVSQFVDTSAPAFVEPIFSGVLSYRLTASTIVNVNAGRSVTPSFFVNQVIVYTQVGASLSQTLPGDLNLVISGGYSSAPYTGIVPAPLPSFWIGPAPTGFLQQTREDTSTCISVALSRNFGSRVAASIFFTDTKNDSSQANYAYSSTQEGLSLSYRF